MATVIAAVFMGSVLAVVENPHNLVLGTSAVSNLNSGARTAGAQWACDSHLTWCEQPTNTCTDTFSGFKCVDLLPGHGCPALVKMGGCTECTCAPGTYDEVKTGSCTGKTSKPCYSALGQWQKDSVLAKHNAYRAKHGACNLTYSDDIAEYTIGSAGFTTTCSTGSLTHNAPPLNNGVSYGENIVKLSGNGELDDYDPAHAAQAWYCGEEGCWDYNTATNNGTTGHMTQVLWKDSTEIGCALCHAKESNLISVYLMCNYYTAGNRKGAYKNNVLSPNTVPDGCSIDDPTPAPDTPAPGTTAPDTPAPDTPAPDTPAPDTPAPDTPAPGTTAPDTPAPDTPAPDTPAPDTPAPDTPAPDTPAPGTTAPDTPAPDTPAPGTPAPDTTAPDTPAPDTPAPDTPAPDTAIPTTAPGVTMQPTPVPTSTPQPNTPEPDVTAAPDSGEGEINFRIKVKDGSGNRTGAGSSGAVAVHLEKKGEPSWYWTTLWGLGAGEEQTLPVRGSPYSFAEVESAILIAFTSSTDNLLVEGIWLQHAPSGYWRQLYVHDPKELLCCGDDMVETWHSSCA